MTPIRLSHSWSRRLYVGVFALAFVYVALFLLSTLNLLSLPDTLRIDIVAVIGAGLVIAGSVALFILVEKITSFAPSLGLYLLFAVTTAYVVQQTNGTASFFLPLWTLAAFFAPLFGAYGWLPIIVMAGSYTAGAYLTGEFTAQTVVVIIASSIVPLAAGLVIWRDTGGEDASEKNVKNLASQLSEVAQKSEIVINAIGDGVIAIDGQGVIQLINPAAQQILGWGKQDALLLNYKSILKLTDENNKELDPSQDPLQQVLNTNQQTRGNKLTAVTQSGKKIGVSLVASPIGDPGSGAIAVFRDVTKERAEEREQAEFISTASHEMRTPVASIEGYLGLAMNPNTATIDQRGHDFIMKAHEAAQHLGRLFQDLLDVSKSEDGRMTSVPKVVDVVQFTQTILQGLSQKAAEKSLELVFSPLDASAQKKIMPVYFVNQDNDHIREILDNLIENAIKYTPKGAVTVDVTGTEDKVVISVKDSGLGIPAEDLPHLFQKFYRVNNADRQDIGGTGLGLYLSRRLAESMQGRLWVESVFGQGSTFFLELPRIDSMEAERLKQQQAAAAAAPAGTSIPVTVFTPSTAAPLETPTLQSQDLAQLGAAVLTAPAAPDPLQALSMQAAPAQAPAEGAPITPAAPPVQAAPPAPAPQPQPAPQPAVVTDPQQRTAGGVRPATTVPRGESLTSEQKAERVRQLEALAQQQRGSVAPDPRTQ